MLPSDSEQFWSTDNNHSLPLQFAASFIPSEDFWAGAGMMYRMLGWIGAFQCKLLPPTFSIELKGDFLWATGEKGGYNEKQVLDAEVEGCCFLTIMRRNTCRI
jgi:hypothetical protein